MRRTLARLGFAAAGAALVACGNPAVDVRVDKLGSEVEGVGTVAEHRPGQPCVLCHSAYGGAEPEMTLAGTVYSVPNGTPDPDDPDDPTKRTPPPPVKGARIVLYDSFGTSPPDDVESLSTNCVGNFWVTKEQWDPVFPVYAEVRFQEPGPDGEPTGPEFRVAMGSWIQRERSCNTCHSGERNQGSAGRIFCVPTMPDPPFREPDKSCAGVP